MADTYERSRTSDAWNDAWRTPRERARIRAIVDRATWQTALDALRMREKAHTREGDALAAARRRLPMVEVDRPRRLVGGDGPVPLLDTFEGRQRLIAYYMMWRTGKPGYEDQCDGCTFYYVAGPGARVSAPARRHLRDGFSKGP